MNRSDASNSGQPFRRKGWSEESWLKKAENADFIYNVFTGVERRFSPEEDVADDWEIRKEDS